MDLIEFINGCTSPFHTVDMASRMLSENSFEELSLADDWNNIKTDRGYFTKVYGSTLIAFIAHDNLRNGMRIAASHTDFPCFKVKPNADIVQDGYGKLNVEVYGGMIVNTWLDRPLSLAGKVALRGDDVFCPETRLVDCDRPLMTIPNLAIHMDRKINEGKALNRQKELLPLAFMADGKEPEHDQLLAMLAKELSCCKDDILSYELYAYQCEKGCRLGFKDEFISSPRLDNLTSVKACLEGILSDKRNAGLDIAVLFDNEEVGSRTKQGGASMVLSNVLERIYLSFNFTRQELLADIHRGFMLSIDVAHALHPNYTEKNDITNKPVLNGGPAIKTAASQSYAGDAEAVAIVKALCEKHGIPYQQYVNRSDIPGGSTLGSITSTLLPMRTMDIGIPILAMHSARETMGADDQQSLERLVKAFFAE